MPLEVNEAERVIFLILYEQLFEEQKICCPQEHWHNAHKCPLAISTTF